MNEPPRYRQELEQLKEAYPDKAVLTVSDVARYVGHSRQWVRENLNVKNQSITRCALALALAKI